MSHHGTRSSYNTPTQTRYQPQVQQPTYQQVQQRQQQQPPAARSSGSNRTVSRLRWGQVWGGLSYLEPGHNNRLILSLRSPLPSEIDFALERLLQVSGHEPDLLRLNDFPGLLDGLLSHIRTFLEVRLEERNDTVNIRGLWVNDEKEGLRRRATEASLILRNLATENINLSALNQHKKLVGLIASILEDGEFRSLEEEGEGEETTELRLYLLEVLELIAPGIPLALPGRAIMSTSAAAEEEDVESGHSRAPEHPSSPSVRLFPILVSLSRSSDRALVLAAFRTLTALALHEANDAPLATFTYTPVFQPLLASTLPHPLETAIELLPLADLDIARASLDYIYQHTLVPANAVSFSSRSDLMSILKLVCSKLHLGEKKELVELVIPVKDGEGDKYWKTQTPRHRNNAPQTIEPEPKLREEELKPLLALQEPTRGLTWMRLAFEAHPRGELTQVALWTAYRAEFEEYAQAQNGNMPMLAAAEVIKMSTEAFPSALPMVTENPEKKFIIRGIRVKDRTDMNTIFCCRWTGCASPLGPRSADDLYRHIYHSHLATSPPPSHCAFSTCTYRSSSPSDQLTADLALHVRVHMPTYHPALGYGDPETKSPTMVDPPALATYDRFHGVLDDAGDPTGLGLLSALVLRNVARTVKTAMGNPTGGASIASLTDGEPSIFESFSRAAEGATRMDIIRVGLDKVEFGDAMEAAKVLVALEETLVETTLKDHGLSTMLGEVLGVILDCKKMAKSKKKTALV